MAALDFPANPIIGEVYSANGVSYQWDGNYWQSNTSTTGVPEAPVDGTQYGRQNSLWTPIVIPAGDWASITGKPATFPPTLPIAQSGVTNLVADLATKEPLIAAGNASYFWAGDKTWKPVPVPTDAYTKTEADAKFIDAAGDTMTGALNVIPSVTGGNQATTKNYVDNAIATREPLIVAGDPLMFFAGDKTWKTVEGGASVSVSETPPASPKDNSFWWSSADGALSLRFNDGNSSQWVQVNGVNGAGSAAAPQVEQFIDLSGKATQDIVVPSWAQAVQIIGSCYLSATTAGTIVQVSTDGTTFFSGATQYAYGGNVLNTGSSGNQNVPTSDANGLWLSFVGDASANSMPMLFTAEINLTKPNASPASFTHKSYAKSYDSSATFLYRSSFIHGYVKQATTGSATAIKALRILLNIAGTFLAGSYVRVRWIGDYAQIPVGTAIPDSPQDGAEYVRVNGVWRLKAQTFMPTGSQNIAVPAGAKMAHVRASLYSGGTNSTSMRWSADGSTFISGASDYSYGGFYQSSGSAGLVNVPVTVAAAASLHAAGDNTAVPATIDLMLPVVKALTAANVYSAQYKSTALSNAANVGYVQYHFSVYSNNATLNALTAMKAFQLYPTSVAWTAGSWINVEWIY